MLSLIPLFSPTLMPMRIAAGIPAWETAVAIALMLAFIAALVWLAGRIYGNAVTRTGAKVKLAERAQADLSRARLPVGYSFRRSP